MKINRKTVMAWINKFQKDNNIERKKGSGRKKKTSDSEDACIMDIINKNNELALMDIKDNLEEKNIIISIPTIHRRLIENDYVYKLPIKKPLLTEEYKKKIIMGIK